MISPKGNTLTGSISKLDQLGQVVGYSNRRYLRREVSHTITYPDGTTETFEFESEHGSRFPFRQRQPKASKNKGRASDSFNRARKTLEFRKNKKVPTSWPCRNRKWACKLQSRQERRVTKSLIKSMKFDQLRTKGIPRDTWLWD